MELEAMRHQEEVAREQEEAWNEAVHHQKDNFWLYMQEMTKYDHRAS